MDDNITLMPLAGYSTATLPDHCVMLTVEFLVSALDKRPQSRNHAMTAAQARELGQALLRAAEQAERRTDRPGRTQ